MTFQTLKDILTKENINPAEYDILETGCVSGFDGFTIEKSSKGYNLFYMERGEKRFIDWFAAEHDVCIAFLKEFIKTGDSQLQKYIQ